MGDATGTSGVRFPPPLIYVGGLVAGWLLQRVIGLPALDDTASGTLSLICFGAGGLLLATALGLFRRSNIDPLPWKPTSALTMSGPYRFTRNPMYLGMALVYLGAALVFELTWSLLLLPLIVLAVQRFVIAREERYLQSKFGDAYAAYTQRVRRWL